MSRLFDQEICYSGIRTEKNGAERSFKFPVVRACVLGGGFDEPLSDGSTASRRRAYTIIIRASDWLDTTPPQDGDEILLESGEKLRVKALNLSIGRDPMVEARSV